ncbi:dihydrofolate reductase family protein [Paenibacillus sp. GSMTC-2017]|uniref:dihydrofolate reductase family protein n=1 Tax=Paenibacillus sp. GSMTC-2017 TaxID=2794350 RepID=UPI0018DA353B|nr:dihydrofolate reductase family protein [Paenibacillus sp. GSMTC-2017]MBH5317667.1 dihydrofolate reductase family protein [Paenibacillus sp. GSMTC-2017]
MRKVILYLNVSLDGFAQGVQDWDINWINFTDELGDYSKEILTTVDTVMWGRRTYLGMQQYWTSVPGNPSASNYDKTHAEWIKRTTKVVFSTTLDKAEWENSFLVKGNMEEEIIKLKNQQGGDIIILGSPQFASQVSQFGLIDEYRININPILLGKGLPMLSHLVDQIKLKLVENRIFESGVIGLIYRLDK